MQQTIYSNFIKENIAPYAAEKIGVFDDNTGNKVGEIPLSNFKPNYGKRLYRFGLLSDIHLESNPATESQPDFTNALKYLNEKENIDFICTCGDLSQVASDQEFSYYKDIIAGNLNKPIYTCTGNHDCPYGASIDTQRWKSYTKCDRTFEISHACGDSTDHFLFLSLNDRNLGEAAYLNEDLTWLEQKLEQYKSERCFIFTHLFFNDKAGDFQHLYPYDRLVGTIESRLLALNSKYLNNIWFSGHSHWKWYLQEFDKKTNVYALKNSEGQRTEAYTVHCPSCAKPRDHDTMLKAKGYITKEQHSEGAVIDVYKDYIDIRGLEFKGEGDTGYTNRYLPIATYRLSAANTFTPYTLKAKDFIYRKGDANFFRAEDTPDGFVKLTFDKFQSCGWRISSPTHNSKATKAVVKLYDVEYVAPNNTWTSGMKSYFGISKADGFYTFEDNQEVLIHADDNNYAHFNMSSRFPQGDVKGWPLVLKIKMDLIYDGVPVPPTPDPPSPEPTPTDAVGRMTSTNDIILDDTKLDKSQTYMLKYEDDTNTPLDSFSPIAKNIKLQ